MQNPDHRANQYSPTNDFFSKNTEAIDDQP